MMRMLEAGGVEVVADMRREADTDNPGGYYELEKAKQVESDTSWLPDMRGKAFKMVSMLLVKLPVDYEYTVIFMHRDMQEILASQAKMLERLGKPAGPDDARMAEYLSRHLLQVEAWLADASNFEVLYVNYSDVISTSEASARLVAEFTGHALDTSLMAAVVDTSLYRNRG